MPSKKFKAVVIYPNNTCKLETLDEAGLKKVLNGGYLEGLTLAEDVFCFIDEDGKSKDLPPNHKATAFAKVLGRDLVAVGDYISGAMIVCCPLNKKREHDGECHDVVQRVIDILKPE